MAAKFEGNEIRIRDKAAVKKLLPVVKSVMKEKGIMTVAKGVEYIIGNYNTDQQSIEQLQKRNDELHRKIGKYVSLEKNMRSAADVYLENLKEQERYMKDVLKQFKEAK
jgi:hypothetical protein